MLNLRTLHRGYFDSAKPMAELLPWMVQYDMQSVVTTDQGIMSAFTYNGIDAEGQSQVDIDQAVQAYERAFGGFGTGSYMWSIVDRRRSKAYPFREMENPVSGHLQSEYAARVTNRQFTNRYSLAVYQRSADGADALFDSIDRIVKEEDAGLGKALIKALKTKASPRSSERYDGHVVAQAAKRLSDRVHDLHYNMSRLGLRQLEGEEMLAYLHMRANPVSGGRDYFPLPRTLEFLNSSLANDKVRRHPQHLEFSNATPQGMVTKYVGVVSLAGWPEGRTFPGSMDFLTAVDGEVTVCHVFKFIDRAVAVKAMESKESYNTTAAVPFTQRIVSMFTQKPPTNFDEGRLLLAQDARDAKAELTAYNRAFGYHNLTILCYGDTLDEMESVRSQIMQRLSDADFKGFKERSHQLAAWTSTLPGTIKGSVRWSQVSFGNASDIAPIRTLWSGSIDSPHMSKALNQGPMPALISLPTDAGVPFFWDPFEAGVGHTAFIGPTRTGKSILVNMLLSQFRKYPGSRVIRFDKDYSAYVPTLLQDGQHIDLTPDRKESGASMAPISLVGNPRHHGFVIRWLRKLIEMGRPADQKLTPDELERVASAVKQVSTLPPEMHTMSQIKLQLMSLGAYLSDWVDGGGRGGWFDNEPVMLEIGDEVCFEMKRLFDDEEVAVLAMDYLFYLVELSLDGRPLIVNVEETWFFLRNQMFVDRLDDFLRTIGKRNGSLWITTQGAHELTGDKQLLGMLEQLKNKVFLPNSKILENRAGYDQLGLSEEQLYRIKGGEPQRDYYVMTPSKTRMCTLRLPSDLVPFLDASNRALQTMRKHAANQDSDGLWKKRYVDEMTGVAA